MSLQTITAIVRSALLEAVEQRLRAAGVDGLSVSRVKGFGNYADFYSREWLTEHMRIEVFARSDQVDVVREAIIGAARTGEPGDGIIAVHSLDEIIRIRDGVPADATTVMSA